jgi:hypothetical protein
MNPSLTVDVKISRVVREFIVKSNGSDLIVPKKDDWLWLILKQNLLTSPDSVPFIPDKDERSEYIRISLLDSHSSKIYARDVGRNIHINTLFRWYLDEYGQNIVARHFRTQFKACFHNFVQGAIFASHDETGTKEKMLGVQKAIYEFCELYGITVDDITYDTLYKSWLRSDQRKTLKGEKTGSPLVF